MIHYITTNGIGNAWVANELRVLTQRRIPFVLHSMRRPHQHFFASEWARRLDGETQWIYPLFLPGLALSLLLAPWLFGRRFFGALASALFAKRESFRARIAGMAHLLVACHWARSLRSQEVSLIHAQWVNSSGTIGMYGAWLLGAPFSFTGHAADLFRYPAGLAEKVKRADFIICISTFHKDFYRQLGAGEEKLHIAYCGIDTRHFSPDAVPRARRRPARVLAGGRLVEKKGFAHLVEACGILAKEEVEFDCVIAGAGPLEAALRRQVEASGLGLRVTITGKDLRQEELPAFLRGGDIFCLPCIQAADGDIDGLPQLLMEAMACGLPVVSTPVAGIPDLIIAGETGLLAKSGDPASLARALLALLSDPVRAGSLARAGRLWVVSHFDIARCLEPLLSRFVEKLGEGRRSAAGASPAVSPCAPASLGQAGK